MRNFLFIFIISFSMKAYSGGFIFPNVSFEYAKIYLFNLNIEKRTYMDYRIYKDGVYGKSKLGNGVLLSEKFHAKLIQNFSKGMDELIVGLGKCFMPRHGIIYYDKNHNPVASLSICFECDKISVWSSEPYTFSEDYSQFNYDKAEKQMANLAKIIRAEEVPVYTAQNDVKKYFNYLKTDSTLNIPPLKSVNAQNELKDFPIEVNEKMVLDWTHPSVKFKFKTVSDTVQNTDGSVNISTRMMAKKEAAYYFLDGQLIKAILQHPAFILPNGICVGLSADQVYQKLNWITPELADPKNDFPSRIEIIDTNWTLKLAFVNHTLVEIEIVAS